MLICCSFSSMFNYFFNMYPPSACEKPESRDQLDVHILG